MKAKPSLNSIIALFLWLTVWSQFPAFGWTQLDANNLSWKQLKTVPYKGKQDDIYFVDPDRGWYINGAGFIYSTSDGGNSWSEELHQPGTYFRSIGFVNSKDGFAGNIGPDYFPNVTDPTPLYETHDGGKSWKSVTSVTPVPIKGVCAIDILKSKFINAGILENKITIRVAGRVGGPASMATARDGGKNWKLENLTNMAGAILDVKFISESTGFLCAGSNSDIERSHALILKTVDGGTSWKKVYESKRPYETTWKCSFPTSSVGYATVQNYDESQDVKQRVVAKTTDGGETWTEVPLVSDHSVQEFGIGFVDENVGWVGARHGGYQTVDGGKNWTHIDMGDAVNKIRIIKVGKTDFVAYAIGFDVYKFDTRISKKP